MNNRVRYPEAMAGTALLLLLLPLAGLRLTGRLTPGYLEFPPVSQYVEHAGFSWVAFALLAMLVIAVVCLFVARVVKANLCEFRKLPGGGDLNGSDRQDKQGERHKWPWWGTLGIVAGICSWFLAWTRLEWFSSFQDMTFTPLWVSYIVTVNACASRRTGRCMMLDNKTYFASLFLASACFWWSFEYLNRFVQNWFYEGVCGMGAMEYFLFATLPFSTVLPAVLGTRDLLGSFPRLSPGLDRFICFRLDSKPAAATIFLLSSAGMLMLGIFPSQLFPLLWLAPLGMLSATMMLYGRKTFLADIADGDWRDVCLLAAAALCCGFFWEMWNWHSLAKWTYAIPYVDAMRIFEMPVLGYSGYLPFGLVCSVAAKAFGLHKGMRIPKFKAIAKASACAAIFVIALYSFPAWWCSRGAGLWYDNDPALQNALARHVDFIVRQSLSRENFSTGSAQFDGEWLFGSYMMAAMGFGQMAMKHAEHRQQHLSSMELCLDRILDPGTRSFDLEVWGSDPIDDIGSEKDHAAFLGYFNLALSLHRSLVLESRFAELNDRISKHLLDRLGQSTLRLLQSYPGEIYPVDNCAVLGSAMLHHKLTGMGSGELLEESLRLLEARYTDKDTGLLIQCINPLSGERADHPRGSGTSLGIYMLSFGEPAMAGRLYKSLKDELSSSFLRFGGVKEYPAGLRGETGDIDSGPIFLGFSASATGFSISGARMFRDRHFFIRLYATLCLAGAPSQRDGKLQFITGGAIGNAIIFAMLTAPERDDK